MTARCLRAFFALAALALAALCLCAAKALADQERIASFKAEVTVLPSGALRVAETITAVARGQSIRRGIYRDLVPPERSLPQAMGLEPYRVLEARRDNVPEKWRVEEAKGVFRVYLGDKDVLLRPGTHVYTLVYEAFSQVRFFQDYDEIYWNVTGNGWAFPVDSAQVTVNLPQGARARQFAAYTGPKGATGADFAVRVDAQGRLVFHTTRALLPGEGLTVAVGWPKGLVAKPSWRDQALAVALGNPCLAGACAAFAAMMAYFAFAWLRVGRDPKPQTVIPLYAPPADMSPAAVQYVSRMGHHDEDLACAVVGLAVSGALTIEEGAGEAFLLTRTSKPTASLTFDEDLVAGELFQGGSPVKLDESNRKTLAEARKALRKTLRDSYSGYLFNPNLGWFAPGALLGGVAAFAAAFSGSQREASAFMGVWLLVWTAGTVVLLSRLAATWRRVFVGRGSFMRAAAAIFTSAIAIPFVLGEAAGLFMFGASASPLALALVMASVAACASFYHLLKAPTAEGRQVMDHIEGFKLYLGVAEQDRLNLLNPPEETPQLFERFLPYAMALGVEQHWGDRFAQVLARAAQGASGYSPAWYHGTSWDASSPGDFCSGFASGISSAVSSSSDTSGSGGGGSSGGGGGGGGGGGWSARAPAARPSARARPPAPVRARPPRANAR